MSNLLKVQKTHFTRNEDIKKEWIIVDADAKILGRFASQLAYRLRGKHRTDYSSHQDIGDRIVVINAAKVQVSGNKHEQKIYYRHTGYTGNLRKILFKDMLKKSPEKIIKLAVKRMLPSGPLGRCLLDNLYIYEGLEHPHKSQNPKPWDPIFK